MRLRTTTLVFVFLVAAVGPAAAIGVESTPTADATAPHATASIATDSAAVAAAEKGCSFPVTLTDATGTEVTVEEKPETATALGASAAQTMWEIGGKEQVVGLDTFSLYLEGAESRTNVSASGFGYDTEKVVGTDADLVLAANTTPAPTVAKLREAGMTVYQFRRANSIADIRAKTTATGRLTGNCRGAAEANAWMMANVETAREVSEGTDAPRVLVPQGQGYVAANGTFIDAMVTAAGGENVAAAEYEQYPQLSDEVILELDPEVLVLAEWGTSLVSQEPYASTTAGQENNTVVVESRYLNQPAPRSVVYAMRNMTKGFHPDAAASAEWTARSEVSVGNETSTSNATDDGSATATGTPEVSDDTPATTPETTAANTPGFGAVAAMAAIAVVGLLARRGRV